jgi:Icc-related predicted phosphoesterase
MPKGDILVHCGDITSQGEYSILQDFNQWLGEQDYSYKIFIAGNHDLSYEKYPTTTKKIVTNAIYLENTGIELEGLKFWGSPYTPAFMNWAFNIPRESTLNNWKKIPNDVDVLITHGPPYGILDSVFGWDLQRDIHQGDKHLLKIVKHIKPLIHSYGHIHESPGRTKIGKTTFVNSSQWTPKAKPIIVYV